MDGWMDGWIHGRTDIAINQRKAEHIEQAGIRFVIRFD